MPEKLERCVRKVKRKKGVDSAWAICKSSIEEDLVTAGLAGAAGYAGKEFAKAAHKKYKDRKKKKAAANAANESMNNIYDRTLSLVRTSVRTSILEKDIRALSKTLGKVATGTARMGMETAKELEGPAGGSISRNDPPPRTRIGSSMEPRTQPSVKDPHKPKLTWDTETLKKRTKKYGGVATAAAIGTAANVAKSSWKDKLQLGLAGAGMTPGPVGAVADIANTGISLARGKWKDAAWNAAASIPGVGQLSQARRMKKAAKALKGGKAGGTAAKAAPTPKDDNFDFLAKGGDDAAAAVIPKQGAMDQIKGAAGRAADDATELAGKAKKVVAKAAEHGARVAGQADTLTGANAVPATVTADLPGKPPKKANKAKKSPDSKGRGGSRAAAAPSVSNPRKFRKGFEDDWLRNPKFKRGARKPTLR